MGKFEFGTLCITATVFSRMDEDKKFSGFVNDSLNRYKTCDWGEISKEDKVLNDEAITNGDRIFATYIYPADGTKIWIITEADRSATTVLFPDEY